MAKNPLVSIILTGHNQSEQIKSCVDYIEKNTQNVDYEIVLANAKSGYVKAVSKASKSAKGKYLLLLDSDVIVKPNWLSNMLAAIESDEKIGLVGANILSETEDKNEAGFLIDFYGEFHRAGLLSHHQSMVDFCSDYCLLVRKDAWEKVGGFDNQFEHVGFEDADLALKFKHDLGLNSVCAQNAQVLKLFNSDYKVIKYTECRNLRFYLKWKEQIQQNLDDSKKGTKINIVFGLNEDFIQHAAVVMASILANSTLKDKYHFYLISDFISVKNKKRLEQLKSIRDFEITYLKVSNKDFKGVKLNNLGFSTLYRFKIFDLISDEKVLYLDSDMIVLKDLRELFETDISDYLAAGVEDILSPKLKKIFSMDETSTYINAGMILFNLDKCREEGLKTDIFKMANKINSKQVGRIINDQDVLNVVMQNKIKIVHQKWNCMYKFDNLYANQEAYLEAAKDPCIVHYIIYKPWNADCKNPYKKLEYFGYLRITPWYDEFMTKYAEQVVFGQSF